MGKYETLRHYLEALDTDVWDAGFADIERVLRFALPKSAHDHNAWWANEASGSHSHAKSWQAAGWITCDVNLPAKRLRFARNWRAASGIVPDMPTPDRSDPTYAAFAPLLARAGSLLHMDDHTEIIRRALEAMIQRAAALELAGFGGMMPDLAVPDRERPAA